MLSSFIHNQDVDDGGENGGGATDPAESRVFDSVVTNLRKSYPKDKMQDISMSFCFICLLRLANERGLEVEVGESAGAEDKRRPEEGDNKVGDLWGLKVHCSPPPSDSLVAGELIWCVFFLQVFQDPNPVPST